MNSQSKNTLNHPCFNNEAAGSFARMHLPVAPACNTQCNYCNRLYDCPNESRPGVTSSVLTPEEALDKVLAIKETIPRLTTAGIAGPGDALANPEATFKTLSLIRDNCPDLNLCLATNGLNLPLYINDIADSGVSFVTVTINTSDPETAARIYSSVTYKGETYQGAKVSEILIQNQLKGVRLLIERGIKVKVNTIIIPGINDTCLKELVAVLKKEGVQIINFMPMINVKGTLFETLKAHGPEFYDNLISSFENDITVMKHCRLCRADAIGFIGQKTHTANRPGGRYEKEIISSKPRVAVAGRQNGYVDEHFGRAECFYIYEIDGNTLKFIEKRNVEKFCNCRETCMENEEKMERILQMLSDCTYILCSTAGATAEKRIRHSGIVPVFFYGTVNEAFPMLEKAI